MVPGLMETSEIGEAIPTHVCRLDRYIEDHGLRKISLIKIDCEGYEFPVLRGLSGFFEHTGQLPPIICEIAPAAYPLMGEQLSDLARHMAKFHYRAFSVTDCKTPMVLTELDGTTDVIFISAPDR